MAEPTWTTKDGREIALRDLGDGHLMNILRMLRRDAVRRNAGRTLLLVEFGPIVERAGDGAAVAFEMEQRQQMETTWRDAVGPQWDELMAEAASRGATADEARAIEADDMLEMQIGIEISALAKAMKAERKRDEREERALRAEYEARA